MRGVPHGIVPHGTTIPNRAEACCVCRAAKARKGQRTCRGCHANYMKTVRDRRKRYIEELEMRVRTLEAELKRAMA